MKLIPHLNDLTRKFEGKGLTIIGVTGESPSRIKPFMEQKKMAYTVACGGAKEYVTRSIPHAWLIDSKGKVIWKGHPSSLSDAKIAAAIEEAKLPPVVTLGKKLRKADALFKAQRLTNGLKELDRYIKSGKDEASVQQAKTARETMLGFGKGLLDEADQKAEAGSWHVALRLLTKVEKYFKYHDLAKQAKAKRDGWKKDETKKLEVEAGLIVLKAEQYDAAGSLVGAAKQLMKVTKGKRFAECAMRPKAEQMLQKIKQQMQKK